MPPENKDLHILQEFALVGLRNMKIRNRLIISYLISTVLPLLFIYLYAYSLYGNTDLTGQILVIALLMIGTALTMTLYTYISISYPIRHMIRTCQAISEGNLEIRIQDHANDELSYLSDNIDGMVTEIQLLLEQRQQSEEKKRKMELKMLQYQINPHFLFNVLESIRMRSLIQGEEVTAGMIEKLAILEGRKEITGASTGGGTSYTAQETMNLKDHIACLQEAITVKKMEEGDFSGLAAADDGVREVRFDHTITRF